MDEFESVGKASKILKYRKESIRNNCNGYSPKCNNFIFSYKKQDKIPAFVNTRTLINRDNKGKFIKK